MKSHLFIFLSGILFVTGLATAAPSLCTGESVNCFDAQLQKWVSFANADTCEDYYDNGWKTRAYCAKEASSPAKCAGQSVDCFDAQLQKWISFPNANTCEDYYDNGWKTRAYCK